jgi:hypothetical protein
VKAGTWSVNSQSARFDLRRSAILIKLCKLRHLPAVNLRRCKPQLFLKSLFQDADVVVFAEHERDNDPVISRANLSISSPVSEKLALLPS